MFATSILPLVGLTAPDALKQNDIIVNKQSVIVLTGNCNASGSTLEAEVFSRKDGSKNVRSYNVDALFANIDAGWTLYRTVDRRTTAPEYSAAELLA